MDLDPDQGGPKAYGSGGPGSVFGSATLRTGFSLFLGEGGGLSKRMTSFISGSAWIKPFVVMHYGTYPTTVFFGGWAFYSCKNLLNIFLKCLHYVYIFQNAGPFLVNCIFTVASEKRSVYSMISQKI
jgi:hypothetical protein